MTELVFSTSDIKNHGGIIRDKNGKFVKKIMPFEISERVLDGEQVVFKTRKVIIRNNKQKIIDEINIPTRNTNTQSKSLIALEQLMKKFKNQLTLINN